MNTYAGRVANFYSTTSPLTLFYSDDSLKHAQQSVNEFDEKIKEAGRKGYFVNAGQKAQYDHAKQRKWSKDCAFPGFQAEAPG